MRASGAMWVGVLAACASDPPPVGEEPPAGAPRESRLRADGFVDVDGRRATVEDAVYELRVRCRAAGAAPGSRPWLRIVAPRNGPDELTEVAEILRGAAYDAGVQHLELALESR